MNTSPVSDTVQKLEPKKKTKDPKPINTSYELGTILEAYDKIKDGHTAHVFQSRVARIPIAGIVVSRSHFEIIHLTKTKRVRICLHIEKSIIDKRLKAFMDKLAEKLGPDYEVEYQWDKSRKTGAYRGCSLQTYCNLGVDSLQVISQKIKKFIDYVLPKYSDYLEIHGIDQYKD